MKEKKEESKYSIGNHLVKFMIDRGLIELDSFNVGTTRVLQKKKVRYMHDVALFAVCNFDISFLTLKLDLPMVYPPVDWHADKNIKKPVEYLSDLTGGYLCCISDEIYNTFRLLTSENVNNFYIIIEELSRIEKKKSRKKAVL